MKCKTFEELISRSLDGELSGDKQSALKAHLASCPSCQRVMAAWKEQSDLLRAMDAVPSQTAEVTWQNVRRALHTTTEQSDEQRSVFGWRLRWAAAMLTAVFVGIVLVAAWRMSTVKRALEQVAVGGTEVEWVEAELPGSSPMVYEDAETGFTVIWLVTADEEGG